MKHLYILSLLILSSCNSKINNNTELIDETEIAAESIKNEVVEKEYVPFDLVDEVIKNLDIISERELICLKQNPNNPDETYMVIPEIAFMKDNYREFNRHILIVETNTGKILYKLFENSVTSKWETSDDLELTEIKIDTAPYLISENKRAFGVRAFFIKNSVENPFSSEEMSLFIKSDTSLKKVLNNYKVMEWNGFWDGDCPVEFILDSKTFTMSKDKTNDYFNIVVSNKITEAKSHKDENNRCISKKMEKNEKSFLKFNNGEYK